MSSRCAASSSTACPGRLPAPVSRACLRMSARKSGFGVMSMSRKESRVLHPGELAERGDEAGPVGALLGEDAPAGLGDAVVTAAALARLLDPAPLDPAAILHAVERRVERGEREPEAAIRALLDEPRDLVPVMALVLDEGENHHLGASLLGFIDRSACRHARCSSLRPSQICRTTIYRA